MKNRRMLRILLFLCLTAGMLFGCGRMQGQGETQDHNTVKNPYEGAVSMEETPVIDYMAPQLLPNILVDMRGYCAGDRKEAAVKGRNLPGEFVLVDAATGREAYRGTVEGVVRHEELDLYSGHVDFSDFGKAGVYYLECDVIGRSLTFPIVEDMYDVLFQEIYAQVMESCRQGSLALQDAVVLLEAYEWYADIFPDGDADGTPDVLRELRGFVSHMEEKGADEEEQALYAAFLAKFSYHYQEFDRKYATECLKRASTVFGQSQTAAVRDADSFLALTELYRATGRYAYGRQITDYKSFFEDNAGCMEKNSYLYAAMTYVDTSQRVDVELCKNFMGAIMERAEEVSKRCEDMIRPVAAKNNGPGDLLKGAADLSCANYIMNNYQYTGVMEDFLHYLMGRNRESVCFYENGEDRGGYLLLLAQMAALHADENIHVDEE